jgi:hypothetical protein
MQTYISYSFNKEKTTYFNQGKHTTENKSELNVEEYGDSQSLQ